MTFQPSEDIAWGLESLCDTEYNRIILYSTCSPKTVEQATLCSFVKTIAILYSDKHICGFYGGFLRSI